MITERKSFVIVHLESMGHIHAEACALIGRLETKCFGVFLNFLRELLMKSLPHPSFPDILLAPEDDIACEQRRCTLNTSKTEFHHDIPTNMYIIQ